MATQTEALVVGDVVKYEAPNNYSREKKTILASQVMLVGTVCQIDSAGKMKVLAAENDEVQTIGITGTLTAGAFTLTFVTKTGAIVTTDPIAYNADTAAIQTGVDTALGASMVVVGGTAITAMTFTFSGTGYTNLAQTPIIVNSSALVGVEDVTVTVTTAGGGGGYDAAGICLEKVTPSADYAAPFLVRHALVNSSNLSYGSGDSTIANAALLALGIVARAEAT